MGKSGKRDWIRRNIGAFLQQYRRKSQRGVEPNDRQYDRRLEQELLRMRPEDLSDLINEADESTDAPGANNRLRLFWFPIPGRLGIGVTALGAEDARRLAGRAAMRLGWDINYETAVADVTPAALDQHHVVPNSGPMLVRGVWFPAGTGV